MFATQGAVRTRKCSEARGGVISLDPPPLDTTAEPGEIRSLLIRTPLGVVPASLRRLRSIIFLPPTSLSQGENAGKHAPVLPLAGGIGSCALASPPARTVICGPQGKMNHFCSHPLDQHPRGPQGETDSVLFAPPGPAPTRAGRARQQKLNPVRRGLLSNSTFDMCAFAWDMRLHVMQDASSHLASHSRDPEGRVDMSWDETDI